MLEPLVRRGGRPRGGDPDALRQRREQERALYRQGRTAKEIAAIVGVTPAVVLEDLRRLGEPRRTGGARRVHAQPAARTCELGSRCTRGMNGEPATFVPDAWAAANGRGRYCSHACRAFAQRTLPGVTARACEVCSRAFVPDRFWASRGRAVYCSRNCRTEALRRDMNRSLAEGVEAIRAAGLLTTSEASARLRLSEGTLRNLVHRRAVPAERIALRHGQALLAFAPDALERYQRDAARSLTAPGLAWLDPRKAFNRLRGMGYVDRFKRDRGLTDEEAYDLITGNVLRRRERMLPHRRGRKRASAPASHHLEWVALFNEISGTLNAAFAERVELGLAEPNETPPTQFEIAAAVAEAHWREHRNDACWRDYPPSPRMRDALHPKFERPAADMVLTAVKRLQNAQTEIPATDS
jgi:hypothetical protein